MWGSGEERRGMSSEDSFAAPEEDGLGWMNSVDGGVNLCIVERAISLADVDEARVEVEELRW